MPERREDDSNIAQAIPPTCENILQTKSEEMLWDNSISKDVAHDIMQCSPEAPTVTEHDDSKDLKKTEQLPAAPSVQSKKDDGPRLRLTPETQPVENTTLTVFTGPGTLCSNECGFVKYDIKKVTKITATWTPSTHALVHFLSDDTIVIVPLKRVTQVDNEVLKEGVNCLVKWTDGVQYEATVKAIGSAEKMQSIQDKMMLSGSDESDRDEEDAERKATQGKETDTVVVEEDDVATEQVPLLATPGLDKDSCTDASFKATVLEIACGISLKQPLQFEVACGINPTKQFTGYNKSRRSGSLKVKRIKYRWQRPYLLIPPVLNLLTVFFCKEELGSGNCTPAPGRQLLNPAIIQGIRLHVNYKYPADSDEEKARWKKLLHINLNSKCRNARASLLSASKGSAGLDSIPGSSKHVDTSA
eukprot:Em0017g256a